MTLNTVTSSPLQAEKFGQGSGRNTPPAPPASQYAVGQQIDQQGHRYVVTGLESATAKDGRPGIRITVVGTCAQCGVSFLATTSERQLSDQAGLNRRCIRHKRPGAKARPFHMKGALR